MCKSNMVQKRHFLNRYKNDVFPEKTSFLHRSIRLFKFEKYIENSIFLQKGKKNVRFFAKNYFIK